MSFTAVVLSLVQTADGVFNVYYYLQDDPVTPTSYWHEGMNDSHPLLSPPALGVIPPIAVHGYGAAIINAEIAQSAGSLVARLRAKMYPIAQPNVPYQVSVTPST